MLRRLRDLAAARSSFAFETTLATRSFAPWLRSLQHEGYRLHLLFLALPSPQVPIGRVAQRVRAGGHFVPDDVVTRRFHRGVRNFHRLYRPIADTWRVMDATEVPPTVVAAGTRQGDGLVGDVLKWEAFVARGEIEP